MIKTNEKTNELINALDTEMNTEMNTEMGTEIGYMAIKNTNIIIEYTSDEERKKLCTRNKGRKYKFDTDFEIAEKFILHENSKTYKVKCDKMTFYLNDRLDAQNKAEAYNSQVELIGELIEITTGDTKVSIQETNTNELNSYIDNNITAMFEFISNLKNLHKELYERLSIIDKKVVDIEHAMEFQKLDAAGGYKLYRLMHVTLNERREIKDNIKRIECLQQSQLGDNIKIADKNLNKVDNQKYKPRVLTELFA